VITKHLKKVFLDNELDKGSVCAIFAHTAIDGKTYTVKFYALQAVIAVGLRLIIKELFSSVNGSFPLQRTVRLKVL